MNGGPYGSGPKYPQLGEGVAKFRRVVNLNGGLKHVDPFFRAQYGEAVLEAIRRKQRSEMLSCLRPTPSDKGYATNYEYSMAVLARYGNAPVGGFYWSSGETYEEAMKRKRALPSPEDLALLEGIKLQAMKRKIYSTRRKAA